MVFYIIDETCFYDAFLQNIKQRKRSFYKEKHVFI